ncbi:MAG: SH3 domain-containing protein [Thermodesulfobacteriota bacterium]
MNIKSTRLDRFSCFILVFFFTVSLPIICHAAEYVSVDHDGIRIRSGPSTDHEIYWEVFKNYPLKVLDRKGKWLHVEDFEGDKGWIYSPLTNKKDTVIVKVDKANIRVGPGTNYERTATALYGVVFTKHKKEGDWIQISHNDGTKGWIYRELIWP